MEEHNPNSYPISHDGLEHRQNPRKRRSLPRRLYRHLRDRTDAQCLVTSKPRANERVALDTVMVNITALSMKTKNIQASLLTSQAVLALCLLLHVGDCQTFEDASRFLMTAQAVITYLERQREQTQ